MPSPADDCPGPMLTGSLDSPGESSGKSRDQNSRGAGRPSLDALAEDAQAGAVRLPSLSDHGAVQIAYCRPAEPGNTKRPRPFPPTGHRAGKGDFRSYISLGWTGFTETDSVAAGDGLMTTSRPSPSLWAPRDSGALRVGGWKPCYGCVCSGEQATSPAMRRRGVSALDALLPLSSFLPAPTPSAAATRQPRDGFDQRRLAHNGVIKGVWRHSPDAL